MGSLLNHVLLNCLGINAFLEILPFPSMGYIRHVDYFHSIRRAGWNYAKQLGRCNTITLDDHNLFQEIVIGTQFVCSGSKTPIAEEVA